MNSIILKLLAQRIALALLSLLAVSVIVFAITAVLPGDAAQEQLGQDATPEALAALRAQMGLDVPAPERYCDGWAACCAATSARSATTQLPVAELIASRLPNSLLLAAVTALFSVPIALTLGIASAVWRGSWFDRAASTGAVARRVGAGVPGRDAGGAGVRGPAALAAGAVVRQRHRVARPVAARLRDAGADAVLRDRRADDAHDAAPR